MDTGICEKCSKIFRYNPKAVTGRYCSLKCACSDPERRRQISLRNKGRTLSQEHRDAVGRAQRGQPKTPEAINKLRISLRAYWDRVGRKSDLKTIFKVSLPYKLHRKRVFARDGFKCTECGDDVGGNLELHHLIPFSYMWREAKLLNLPDTVLMDDTNVITLCSECHKKTDSYARHGKYSVEWQLMDILEQVFQQLGKPMASFDAFYRSQIEMIGNKFKEKLQ